MKVLIAGASGQLGCELLRTAPTEATLVQGHRTRLDITDAAAVQDLVRRENPDVIVNAAAYTAVDKAETERALAFAVNAEGAGYLASAAAEQDAYLVQVSTDFVFSGEHPSPYRPEDPPAPISAYGASKAEGEQRVREVLGDSALILRTAWVYSAHGNNFVKTMLRLMRERESLNVVADQIGTPTWANGLARAIWRAVDRRMTGVHHWTDAGVASWYDFAVAIDALGREKGLLERRVDVRPICTEDYPTPARRPAYSVLDKSATWSALTVAPVHWRTALSQMLDEFVDTSAQCKETV